MKKLGRTDGIRSKNGAIVRKTWCILSRNSLRLRIVGIQILLVIKLVCFDVESLVPFFLVISYPYICWSHDTIFVGQLPSKPLFVCQKSSSTVRSPYQIQIPQCFVKSPYFLLLQYPSKSSITVCQSIIFQGLGIKNHSLFQLHKKKERMSKNKHPENYLGKL